MGNDNNNIDISRLGVDTTILPLAILNDTGYVNHLRACQCFSQWTKGYSEEQIALFFRISVADVESDLAHIETLYTKESIEIKLQEREEILRLIEREKNLQYKLSEDLSVSADTMLKRGHNPGNVLRRLREELTAEDPTLIASLREENNRAAIDETAIDLAPEAAYRLIRELRGKETKPAQKVMTISRSRQEAKSASREQSMPTTNGLVQKSGDSRTDRRITVRLDGNLNGKLHQYSQDSSTEVSMLVRKALVQFLESNTPSSVAKSNEMPPEALSCVGRFQTMGSDLREELRKQFLNALAAAYVTGRRWPRAKWVRELYLGLVPLYQVLKDDDVRQN